MNKKNTIDVVRNGVSKAAMHLDNHKDSDAFEVLQAIDNGEFDSFKKFELANDEEVADLLESVYFFILEETEKDQLSTFQLEEMLEDYL